MGRLLLNRLLLAAGVMSLTLTACGQWKGDGNDEAIPDALGQTTGVNRAFGVPSQTYPDNAAYDMLHDRPYSGENPFEEESAKSE